jgi:hypothetical protein
MYDDVNIAVYIAIKSSEIKLASDSYDLNVSMNTELPEPLSQPDEEELN